MKFITLLISIWLISCQTKKDKFKYDTSIASAVYESQLKYLDNTLSNYSRISDTGMYFWRQNEMLEEISNKLKDKISKGQKLSSDEQQDLTSHFIKDFSTYQLVDSEILKKIKGLPIETISDVDLIKLFIKNNFVAILTNNKLLPFDTWGTMASSKNWTINNGDSFEVDLATIASSARQPNEWFHVKEDKHDILSVENVLDTLHPDEFGTITFKTKEYTKGENVLTFVTRLNTPSKSAIVERQVIFYVK